MSFDPVIPVSGFPGVKKEVHFDRRVSVLWLKGHEGQATGANLE